MKLKRADEPEGECEMEGVETDEAVGGKEEPIERESSQAAPSQLAPQAGPSLSEETREKDDLESDIEAVERMETEIAQLSDELE